MNEVWICSWIYGSPLVAYYYYYYSYVDITVGTLGSPKGSLVN